MSDNTPTSGGTPLKDIILETSMYDSTEIDNKVNECLKFDDNGNLDLRANTDNKTELLGFSGGNVAEGIGTQIGSKCFYIVSGDYNAKTITLEAPVDEQINQFKNKQVCYKFSANFTEKSKVTAVDIENCKVTIDKWPDNLSEYERFTESNGTLTNDPSGNIVSADNQLSDRFFMARQVPNIGNHVTDDAHGCHVEGLSSKVLIMGGHAEGLTCVVAGKYGHAEGRGCVAGYAAHAEGRECQALGDQSHASGFRACSINNGAWTWSPASHPPYEDNGESTFNINPRNDINGFYIGKKNLETYLEERVSPLKTQIANLQHAIDVGFVGTILTLTSDIKYYSYDRTSDTFDIDNTSGFQSSLKTSLKSLKLGDNIKVIKNCLNCGKLTDVYAYNVEELSTKSFANANSLTNIVVSDKLKVLGQESFINNTKLENINLSATQITSLLYGMFKNCTSLSSVTLPDTIKVINGDVFAGCRSLSNWIFDIPGDLSALIPSFTSVKFKDVTNSKNNPNFRIEDGKIIATKNNQVVYDK